MQTLRERIATLRQPLGVLLLLCGLGALGGAAGAFFLPALPAGVQQASVKALGWVPGLYEGLELTAERPEGFGSLRLEHGERLVARFPARKEGWSTGGLELEGFGLVAVVAAWGAGFGLLLQLLWFVRSSRRVLGLALVLGVSSGLLVAHSLDMLPRYWASFWLRGAGGLPGVHEIVGDPVGIDAQPGPAYLSSLGGRLADYPSAAAPWAGEAVVSVTGRGRAFFATWSVVGWLAILLVAAGVRGERWRHRVPLLAAGLAGVCWLVLPLLPSVVGQTWMELLAGGGFSSFSLPGELEVLRSTRLGWGVGYGFPLLAGAAWLFVLTPVGLALGGLSAWRSRREEKARARREQETWAPTPESLPLSGEDDEPSWLGDYEGRRNGGSEAAEPGPAPPEG